ncbi:MAG: hypothetical protein WCI95_11545 [bacterium]
MTAVLPALRTCTHPVSAGRPGGGPNAAPDNSDPGFDHGVVLDGSGTVKEEMKGGYTDLQKLHEQTHIVQLQGGIDPRPDVILGEEITVGPVKEWDAIPYKQLFHCFLDRTGQPGFEETGKKGWCYFQNYGSAEAASFRINVQQTGESDLWAPGAGIWKHSDQELAHLEIPVSNWQIRKTTAAGMHSRIAARLSQYNGALKIGDVTNRVWVKYKEAIDRAKREYQQYAVTWRWKLPDHVYSDFK